MKTVIGIGIFFIVLSLGECLYNHKLPEALAWGTALIYSICTLVYEIKRTEK